MHLHSLPLRFFQNFCQFNRITPPLVLVRGIEHLAQQFMEIGLVLAR